MTGLARQASPSSPAARRREAQGRLFWVWLLTLPIILLLAAALAFGSPWPNPTTQRIGMLALAFPVLFVVGEPLFRDARRPGHAGGSTTASVVAAAALLLYASGAVAFFAPLPSLAGLSALVVATYLSARYLLGRY